MSSFLLFVMVAAMFVHTFLNFFLGVYAKVVAKAQGLPSVQAALYSVEEFFAKIFAGIFGWFKHL
jgi:uncharacterized protein YqhQ